MSNPLSPPPTTTGSPAHVHQCRFAKMFPYHECECGAIREGAGEWRLLASPDDPTRGMSQGNRKGPSPESQVAVAAALRRTVAGSGDEELGKMLDGYADLLRDQARMSAAEANEADADVAAARSSVVAHVERLRAESDAARMAARNAEDVSDRLRSEVERLRQALDLAATRMEILADRMEGCNEDRRGEGRRPPHELLDEARAFVDETRIASRSSRDTPEQEKSNG